MAHTKRRVRQHIMEEQSYRLLRDLIPEEWAVHEYRPDYGIDLVVEIFKYIDDDRTAADTLGELFFLQLKSVKQMKVQKITVRSRGNVEKGENTYDNRETKEIDVVPFLIDTDELLTVQTMGPTIAVVLCLACLDTGRMFYVCLNDLVEKSLLVDDPAYAKKGTKTIYLPVKNEITKGGVGLLGLRFMAKRPKFYAAFNRFSYQQNEIWHYMGLSKPGIITVRNLMEPDHDLDVELRPLLLRFLTVLKCLDIWTDNAVWELVGHYRKQMTNMEATLEDLGVPTQEVLSKALLLWNGLTALSSTYEEICREWFLPTLMGDNLS